MTYRSQALGSALLGTPLTFALCGLYAEFGPGAPATNYVAGIFLLLPVWIAILIWGLKREQGRTVWLGLTFASLITAAAIWAARQTLAG